MSDDATLRCDPCDAQAIIRGAVTTRWSVPMCAICARLHDEQAYVKSQITYHGQQTLGTRYGIPRRRDR